MAVSQQPPLPTVPSELLSVALIDLAMAEGNEKYVVDMGAWHEPRSDGKCRVCMAGAVMAHSLKCEPDQYYTPYAGTQLAANKALFALDAARCGDWLKFLSQLVTAEPVAHDDLRCRLASGYNDTEMAIMAGALHDNRMAAACVTRAVLANNLRELGPVPGYEPGESEWRKYMRSAVRILKKGGY